VREPAGAREPVAARPSPAAAREPGRVSSPRVIVTDAVSSYLASLRPEPDSVLAEMEAQGQREGIPIVVPETGQLLQLLALARGARRVVEVGTAIGVSTLYLTRALPPDGLLVSFEIDEARHRAARDYLQRAGVLERVDLRLQDAREGLRSLSGSFDLAFIDGVKAEYGEYLDLLLPLLGDRALLAIDNVLMSGTVAEGRGDGHWTDDQVAVARALNERVTSLDRFVATVTPVGDGVLLAVRG
jgi:caffeoyl-CoA O-methyltransferase